MSKLNLEVITPDTNVNSFGYSIFMAGGISNCFDWQSVYISRMKTELKAYADYIDDKIPVDGKLNIVLVNPRRSQFDISNKQMAEDQIKWEFDRLHSADLITFWFSEETVCPIVCYELGYWLGSIDKEVIIGISPDYKRKIDIEIQSRLAGYDNVIFDSVEALVYGTADFLDNRVDSFITPF